MRRYHSYLNSAKEILQQYNGQQPLASFLSSFFREHKKMGSTDRKHISHLCYCYFRLGKALRDIPAEERILIGLFLCSSSPDEILAALRTEWNNAVTLPLEEKLSLLNYSFSLSEVFPRKDELSREIEYENYCRSFFIQPDLFIRIRPGFEKEVLKKIKTADIKFTILSSNCIALPNSTKIENIIELNKEAVIQDYSSQETGYFFNLIKQQSVSLTDKPEIKNQNSEISVWDCCAGSGGKSILAKDILGNINLTVSDIRESILANLKKRFAAAGINDYQPELADLSNEKAPFKTNHKKYSIIIADVPCTGSGAWSRTPEQLYYFDEKETDNYAALQKKIISTVLPSLLPGGWLLYITCSVFKKENENVVSFIRQNFHLELAEKKILPGYNKKADTLFAALLKKPL